MLPDKPSKDWFPTWWGWDCTLLVIVLVPPLMFLLLGLIGKTLA